MNTEAGIVVVVGGIVVLILGSVKYWDANKTARYPQSSRYASWTGLYEGLRSPFSSVSWFIAFCVLGFIAWIVFA